MIKAHSTALRHGTRILSLQMLDRAEVMLGIRWSEQKFREKFLGSEIDLSVILKNFFPVEAHQSLFDNFSNKINNL